jgi:hypothetical protein
MDFKEKLLQRKQEEDASRDFEETEYLSPNDNEAEITKYIKFFGVENVRSYPACLDLRLADGNSKALPYSYIVEINFDASNGIEIITAMKKILITGRNLKMLYNYLTVFRVKYIQANIGNDLAEEDTLFVKRIKIDEL